MNLMSLCQQLAMKSPTLSREDHCISKLIFMYNMKFDHNVSIIEVHACTCTYA